MELSELLVLLHYEVQKSHNFVHYQSEEDRSKKSIRCWMQEVKLESPRKTDISRVRFLKEDFEQLDKRLQALKCPFEIDVISRPSDDESAISGRVVVVDLVCPSDAKQECCEIGKLKVVLRPILH